jgi:hypothetical protein
MLFSPIAWALFAFTLMVALPGALASPSPKRSKRHPTARTKVTIETYPAIEGEETTELSVPARILPFRPVKQAQSPAPAPMTVQVVAKDPASGEAETPAVRAPATKFETVPADKRGQILRRIELCADLFRETGRAYDYRSMTTRELESELNAARTAKSAPTVPSDES